MCGIVGYNGTENAKEYLIKGLKNLEYRGYDSCGVGLLNNNEINVVKTIGRVEKLEKQIRINSNIGIAHTRWATHGKVNLVNSHPHFDMNRNIFIVHNGIIENYAQIRSLLENAGYVLQSNTDSEVIPNLIDLYYKELKKQDNSFKSFLDAISCCLKDLKGSYALAIMCRDFPDKLIGVKKDSPLVVGTSKNGNFLCSDMQGILEFTNNFYVLNDYEYAILDKNKITFYDFDQNKIYKELKTIKFDQLNNEELDCEYMYKEIFEQPQALKNTISYYLDNPIFLKKDILENIDNIYLIGCGTAMHSCLCAKYTFEKLINKITLVDVASEFRYKQTMITKNSLCIFVSQSGETADTIACLKLCKNIGAKTIAITNAYESSISQIADKTYYTKAGPEIAVASTKAYTCQIALLNILAIEIASTLNKISNEEKQELLNELKKIPTLVDSILNSKDIAKIKDFAKKIICEQNIYFIGRLIDEVSSREGALKLKEISYIHAESYPSGELKHGAIALIEPGITVVATITDPKIASKTISNIEEVITRGAKVFLITCEDIDKNYDLCFKIPKTNEFLSPILSIIPMQLFAFYVAKYKGYDIDKPRNLAKSVTVE